MRLCASERKFKGTVYVVRTFSAGLSIDHECNEYKANSENETFFTLMATFGCIGVIYIFFNFQNLFLI